MIPPDEEQEFSLHPQLAPLPSPDGGIGQQMPVGASQASAAAAQRPVIPHPNAMPRGVNVPHPQDIQTGIDQTNLNNQKNLTPKIWRPGGAGGIKNPILRALARVGDVAAESIIPTVAAHIPGTDLHHKLEVQGAQNRYNKDISNADVQSQTAEREAQAEHLLTMPQIKTAFEAWQVQNPGVPVEKFFEAQQNAKPDHNPTEFGEWRKANPNAPLSGWFDLKNSSKPDTAADADNRYRAIEQKLLMKQPVTPEEEAFVKSHEKLKTLGQQTTIDNREPNLFTEWRKENPGKTVEEFLKAQTGSRAEATAEGKQKELAQSAHQALSNLEALGKQDTPASNYAFLMNFIGMSYEGVKGARLNRAEIERAALTRTLPDALQHTYDLWIQKKQITPQQKADMLNTARAIAGTFRQSEGSGEKKTGTKDDPLGIK